MRPLMLFIQSVTANCFISIGLFFVYLNKYKKEDTVIPFQAILLLVHLQ
jgi:hypothetical protein